MHNDITPCQHDKRYQPVYPPLYTFHRITASKTAKNTSEAHHQPAQAICSTYLLPYSVNIKKAVKPVGNYRFTA